MIENEDNVLSFHLIAIGTFNDDLSVEVIVEPLTASECCIVPSNIVQSCSTCLQSDCVSCPFVTVPMSR